MKKTNSCALLIQVNQGPIEDFIEKNKIELKFILNTHHHYDHVGGNKALKKNIKPK